MVPDMTGRVTGVQEAEHIWCKSVMCILELLCTQFGKFTPLVIQRMGFLCSLAYSCLVIGMMLCY